MEMELFSGKFRRIFKKQSLSEGRLGVPNPGLKLDLSAKSSIDDLLAMACCISPGDTSLPVCLAPLRSVRCRNESVGHASEELRGVRALRPGSCENWYVSPKTSTHRSLCG